MTLRNRNLDIFFDSTASLGKRSARSSSSCQSTASLSADKSRATDQFPHHTYRHHLLHSPARRSGRKPLRILKFGGTSVGDAHCIERVVEIVRTASREVTAVVVVSAMNGVTNKLLEAANSAEAGDNERVSMTLKELGKRHEAAATELIHSDGERNRISDKMREIFRECAGTCRETTRKRELTLLARDSIVSVGERLSALIVAGALAERGLPSEAVEATGLVVTDDNHGSAEPLMELTKERCNARLRPLMQHGVVPVITGFIGATVEGAVTTLGRGSSDYSATILGAALDAQEVVIWTDVDGVLTADPRMVASARTIPEMSYHEAAELADFGAKVMHPKIFRPLEESGIPIWIRNTFAPDCLGTKITPVVAACAGGVRAITAKSSVALITVRRPGNTAGLDILDRTFTTAKSIPADILLISQSSSQDDICFAVAPAAAVPTIKALQIEFAKELAKKSVERITIKNDLAVVTLVGREMSGISESVGRTFDALEKSKLKIVAVGRDISDTNFSFVVAKEDVQLALMAVHREFQLESLQPQTLPVRNI